MISARRGLMSCYGFGKERVEDSKKLEISWLKKMGYLSGYKSGTVTWSIDGEPTGNIGIDVRNNENEQSIRFNYTVTDRQSGEKEDFNYSAKITSTPCNYGGERYWFICGLSVNGKYCGRRVGTLYLAPSGRYFGCRHCYNLTYESRNESKLSRTYPFSALLLDKKIHELKDKIKTPYYAGKPTKKYKRLLKMCDKLNLDMFSNENKEKI